MNDASLLHHLIANLLDLFELLRLHRLVVREVKSQLVLRNKGAFLIHLLAQNLAQRKIQNVCCRVVLCHKGSPSVVNLREAINIKWWRLQQ